MNPVYRTAWVGPDDIAAFRQPWQDLANRSLEPSVFNEPAFVLAATRHLNRPRRLDFLLVQEPGHDRLVGLCAIVSSHLPGMPVAVACWSHEQATSAFPLLDREAAGAALSAMLAEIARKTGRPALLLHGLQAHGPTSRLISERLDRRVFCLDERARAVLLPGENVTGLSAKARKEARRQWNRLAEQGDVSFRSDRSPAAMAGAVERFLELESRGWKGRRRTAFATRPGTAVFAREVMAGLGTLGQARVDSLLLDERVIAAGLVLRSGDRGFFWKTAYDEDLSRFSPGVQLTMRLTDLQRREDGLSMTDSCAAPGHAMIERIWPDRIVIADYIVSTTIRSSVSFALASAWEQGRRHVRLVAKRAYHTLLGRLARRPSTNRG